MEHGLIILDRFISQYQMFSFLFSCAVCGCEYLCSSGGGERGQLSSWMGGNEGEMGGEVEDTELVLLGRLILPPNEPSIVLQ